MFSAAHPSRLATRSPYIAPAAGAKEPEKERNDGGEAVMKSHVRERERDETRVQNLTEGRFIILMYLKEKGAGKKTQQGLPYFASQTGTSCPS